jgi:GTP cyclohydrolase II
MGRRPRAKGSEARAIRVNDISYRPIDAETPATVFAVDRAIGDLRRGGMVVLSDRHAGASLVLSTEYASERRLRRLAGESGGPVTLVVTARRAAALGLAGGAGPVVALPLPDPGDAARIHDLSDPTAPAEHLAERAVGLTPGVPHTRDAAAVALAKLGSLLPAVLTKSVNAAAAGEAEAWAAVRGLLVVDAADIDSHRRTAPLLLNRVSAAKMPLADAENTTIVTFRPADGGTEHLAMVIGVPDRRAPVLARIHSQCFTGDLLGSLRCDCGDQLRGAIRHIAAAGSGLIIYLAQEGRGIGLVNKLRAYELQDHGLDTFEANEQLGFDADERHYLVAAEILRQLGFVRVRLLTNNPEKIAALERAGIEVVERVPHAFPATSHNERYLATKAARGGHLL